jgi:hypothetical protein
MKKQLYKVMAQSIQARLNCIKSGNTDWQYNHENSLDRLLDKLPHGSGLDYTWHYDFNKSHGNKIVLTMSFHAMDQNGFYDKVIDFTLSVTPDFISDIDLSITGNFGKYQDIKHYLHDILSEALTSEIEL